jgi:hypothetical protein
MNAILRVRIQAEPQGGEEFRRRRICSVNKWLPSAKVEADLCLAG